MIELKWTPQDDIEELRDELADLKARYDTNDPTEFNEWAYWADMNMANLPTADIPDDADTSYPIWAMDNDGYCLVGEDADGIEYIDDIIEQQEG